MGWLEQLLPSISTTQPVLIAGPTASGKSALAMAVALRDGRVIVNADALQVYARWRILTARPTPDEEAAVNHHLYGHVGRDVAYSAGQWLRDVAAVIDSGKPVVIVGGSGLNLSALTTGLADIPITPADIRTLADSRKAHEGIAALLAELDTATRARIDPANPARVQRAWEVLVSTGRGLADWHESTPPALIPLACADCIALRPDVEWLNDRIDRRFDQMMAGGALDEVSAELPYWVPSHPSAQAIGAAELVCYLRGEILLKDAVDASKLASRQYAKRQRTWLRSRMGGWRGISQP